MLEAPPKSPKGLLLFPRVLQLGVACAIFLQVSLSRAQQPGTDYYPYPLPPSPWKQTQYPGDNSCLTPKKETANIQVTRPKINSTPLKYKGLLWHRNSPPRLQFCFAKFTEKEKYKQSEEAQEPFAVKTGEFT